MGNTQFLEMASFRKESNLRGMTSWIHHAGQELSVLRLPES